MLFDSHAHYDDKMFDEDRDKALLNAHKEGVIYIINAGSDINTSIISAKLSEKYDFVYAAVGIHPHSAHEAAGLGMEKIKELAKREKTVAVGETGLDYYYKNSDKKIQKESFIKHINLARELALPLIIHDRDAHKDCIDILRAQKAYEIPGVMHCFTGSVETAKILLDNNFYIGVGGLVTFKNAKKIIELVKYVPLNNLLIETDCPYMSPEPLRGKRNCSENLRYIAEKIADIKGIKYDKVASITLSNAKKLFNIKG